MSKKIFRVEYHCGRTMSSRFWIDAHTVFGAVVMGYIEAWKDVPQGTKFRSFSVTLEEDND